jgi:hypothetical protein
LALKCSEDFSGISHNFNSFSNSKSSFSQEELLLLSPQTASDNRKRLLRTPPISSSIFNALFCGGQNIFECLREPQMAQFKKQEKGQKEKKQFEGLANLILI